MRVVQITKSRTEKQSRPACFSFVPTLLAEPPSICEQSYRRAVTSILFPPQCARRSSRPQGTESGLHDAADYERVPQSIL